MKTYILVLIQRPLLDITMICLKSVVSVYTQWDMGQVTALGLSSYLVLLSIDSKPGNKSVNKTAPLPWPDHRSITPQFVTPTAISCVDNSWRSTTLSLPKKLTSSTAYLEWCHVHFIRDSYSTFICRVIRPSKNSMELFCKAKFDFKSIWNRDSATSHHKHPVCQSPAGDAEKLTNVWSRYFGTNRIIDNWHWCLGVMWRKQKHYFDE